MNPLQCDFKIVQNGNSAVLLAVWQIMGGFYFILLLYLVI
jgi:hypothetical protein